MATTSFNYGDDVEITGFVGAWTNTKRATPLERFRPATPPIVIPDVYEITPMSDDERCDLSDEGYLDEGSDGDWADTTVDMGRPPLQVPVPSRTEMCFHCHSYYYAYDVWTHYKHPDKIFCGTCFVKMSEMILFPTLDFVPPLRVLSKGEEAAIFYAKSFSGGN